MFRDVQISKIYDLKKKDQDDTYKFTLSTLIILAIFNNFYAVLKMGFKKDPQKHKIKEKYLREGVF